LSFFKVLKSALFLFVFWVLLTGKFDLSSLLLGVICALFVAYAANVLLKDNLDKLEGSLAILTRFILFLGQLVIEIGVANIDVAERVLNPRLPIEPAMVKYKCHLRGEDPQTLLANAITLTPGTLTVDIDEEEGIYYIHCLADTHARNLMGRKLENMVNWVYKGVRE